MICLVILSLGVSTAFAADTDKNRKDEKTVPDKTENKLTENELNRMTRRVEEIKDMNKSELSTKEKRELKKELKGLKENIRASGGYIYIGAGTLLVVILLLILLL